MDAFAYVYVPRFAVACESLFRPKLAQVPMVIVDKDQQIFSCSAAASALGFEVGQRWEAEQAPKEVVAFGSNEALYTDIASRFIDTLSAFGTQLEAGTQEGAFLATNTWPKRNRQRHVQQIVATVQRWVGLSAVVGLGATKTLAYVASQTLKTGESHMSMSELSEPMLRRVLLTMPLSHMPQIGQQDCVALQQCGIENAWDLVCTPHDWLVKKQLLQVADVQQELQGHARVSLSHESLQHRTLTYTQLFKPAIDNEADLLDPILRLAHKAAMRLHKERLCASGLRVFLTTANFRFKPRRSRTGCLDLKQQTSDPLVIHAAVRKLVDSLYQKHYRYQKAGIVLTHLSVPEKWGSSPSDAMLSLSPRVTTRWSEIPTIS